MDGWDVGVVEGVGELIMFLEMLLSGALMLSLTWAAASSYDAE